MFLKEEKLYRRGEKGKKRDEREGGENKGLRFLQGIDCYVCSIGIVSAASPPL